MITFLNKCKTEAEISKIYYFFIEIKRYWFSFSDVGVSIYSRVFQKLIETQNTQKKQCFTLTRILKNRCTITLNGVE